jgi:hypothetical protein
MLSFTMLKNSEFLWEIGDLAPTMQSNDDFAPIF